jgi:hypothetical protein
MNLKGDSNMKKSALSVIGILLGLAGSISRADHPAVHGILLFGNHVTYASHLPMFHSPHDYQVLLKLSLAEVSGGHTVAAYDSAKATSAEYFTLVPERMDLTQVISGAKKSFKAAIFQGHFERGGKNLGLVQVSVEKIVYATHLDANAASSNNYFVFGESGEYFAAHIIQGKPNFDAIAQVGQPSNIDLPVCHRRFCPDPQSVPVADEKLPLTLPAQQPSLQVGDFLGGLGGASTPVQKVIYLEQGELSE